MKINRIYNQLVLLLTTIFMIVLSACTDDALIENYGEESIEPVELKLNFMTANPETAISSRAPSDNTVNDLYVFIFNANGGGLRAKRYYTLDELTNGTDGSQPETTEENNWVKITTTVGASYIYGVANVAGSTNHYNGDLKVSLDAVESLDDLQNLSIEIKSGTERNGNTYLMAGAVNNGESYSIVKGQDIRIIRLRRLDSIITFNFSVVKDSNCEDFVLESYQVFNVPKKTYVLDHNATAGIASEVEGNGAWDAAQDENEFFNTDEITGMLNTEKKFTFYMAENRKNRKKDADGTTPKELYACREKETKDIFNTDNNIRPNRNNVVYEYAPDYGTYVLVKGKFLGKSTHYSSDADKKDDYSGDVEASVRYIIHLGYVDNNADDFFSNRNTKYTYNVKISGVDDIVVEVVEETETENAPGAEGDVLFVNGTTKYNLDAHYETVLLRFNINELANKPDAFFAYRIKTPYADYTKTVGGSAPTVKDIDWIRITRNEKNENIYSTDLSNYPAEDYMTIDNLIEELKEIATTTDWTGKENPFDNNGDLVYTCHINEFYYDEEPANAAVTASDLWKTFVNQPNRELHILSDIELSPDGQSSITRSTYVISQRAIQTFYNTNLAESYSAYGVETVNETGPLDSWSYYRNQIGKYDNDDKNNGLANYQTILGELTSSKRTNPTNWTTYVNWSINGYTSSNVAILPTILAMIDDGEEWVQTGSSWGRVDNDYQKAYLACMQRNRDLDGDGVIDDEEIKWYLPAINQYAGMFLGDAGLSEEAKLYTETDYVYKHFISSTAQNNTNLIVYWAEESVSTSCNTEYSMNSDGGKNHYRCMRNLGNGTPVNYYSSSGSINDGGVTITVPYLNTNSLRSTSISNGDLGNHTNWESESRISKGGFKTGVRVENNNIGEVIVYSDVGNNYNTPCYNYSDNDVKEGYWRVPNLRELYLMYAVGGILQGEGANGDVSRTRFYFSDRWNPAHRIGWRYNGADITMGNGGEAEGSHIRCIRDIQ